MILLLIIGPNQQSISEQLIMTTWHDCYILFQLYECHKRLGSLLYAQISCGIYYLQVYCIFRILWNPNGRAREDMVGMSAVS